MESLRNANFCTPIISSSPAVRKTPDNIYCIEAQEYLKMAVVLNTMGLCHAFVGGWHLCNVLQWLAMGGNGRYVLKLCDTD